MSVFLYGSNEVNKTHENDLDEEKSLHHTPKCFRKKIESGDSDFFHDSSYEEIDFSKLAQHAEKKNCTDRVY